MQFRQHQWKAHRKTLHLFAWFGVLLVALTAAVNLFLALLVKLVLPIGAGYPALFFETNTAVVVLFVIGGAWIETARLREGGGARVAHWLGGVEINDPDSRLEQRLLNVVDEMALASGQATPRVFVLRREDAINAMVAGWGDDDIALCVTRGALERLNRAELQGLVAHEFGHIKEEDLPLTMRLLALVWGLSLVHGYGRSLMSADEQGRVNSAAWLIGLVLSIIGWLGWLAGRGLQAAIARQREYLADASAIQFTRTRDGIGNVLRKVWHDQQTLTATMHSPAAEMVASLLLYEPPGMNWLSSHPPIQARIARICGAVLPPIPAPILREEVNEARHTRTTAEPSTKGFVNAPVIPLSALSTSADHPAPTMSTPLHDDRDALARLQRRQGPTERRLVVLGLMMDPENHRELKLWRQIATGLTHANAILEDVQHLHPKRRLPEFERMTAQMSGDPIEQKRKLIEEARDLLRADGRVTPLERLWWLTLRHRLDTQRVTQSARLAPLSISDETPTQFSAQDLVHAGNLTAYLARVIPESEDQPEITERGYLWCTRVMNRFGMPDPIAQALNAPDADTLMHSLAEVQELSWLQRPLLLKAWVEETINLSSTGLLSDRHADALRLMACLLACPLPPMLETHYRRIQ
ncbi:M48 family metalloprotease [Aquabacterium sp.]|uniref:M48 family metalloprotease n=1 Tax=Aquabacterium sp. TaxID=1872578 RepID=UPI003B74A5A8